MAVTLFTPLLLFWSARQAAGARPSSLIDRMRRGAVIAAAAYLFLAAIEISGLGQQPPYSWLAALLFLISLTMGELYFIPTALSIIGQSAPRGRENTIISFWFIAAFTGNLCAGLFGSLYSLLGATWFFVAAAAVAGSSALFLTLSRSILAPLEGVAAHPDR
ncbi:hypothetical protein AB2M62_07205 [Sphingomonas sp. MMS12-HWE2-04]|uniref:hypothetical protein n=1 Tax=Sphingomonas sp. MMS12-HWE2-04 TaxID=3234199 RepID=UPI00384F46B2